MASMSPASQRAICTLGISRNFFHVPIATPPPPRARPPHEREQAAHAATQRLLLPPPTAAERDATASGEGAPASETPNATGLCARGDGWRATA